MKDPETGKWKTATGKLIGRIIPGVGFCPNDDGARNEKVTCFNYGEYLLACALARDDFERLKECFNVEEAFLLFSLACIFVFKGYIGLKPSEGIYERTLIAHDYPGLKYSYHRISRFLSAIGRNDRMLEFQRRCMEGAGTVAVDGHVIPSDSDCSDLSFNGYKAKEVKGEQMNLLVALDIDTHLPLATKVFPGYMVYKTDFIEFIRPLGDMDGKLFIMDTGFYSKENISYLAGQGANYIMPLSSNLESYRNAMKSARGRNAQSLYSASSRTDLVEYHECASNEDGVRVTLFPNISERENLSKEYIKKMEKGSRNHTMEGLQKNMKTFGLIVLETNLGIDAQDVYRYYKARWSIETYYDRIKHSMDFSELNLSEYGMVQAVAFVMLLAGRID